jgi:superfamily I DNA/RNA helicase
MTLSDELNAEQRRAVETDARHVMIVAGPGTGKTKTLVARIAWLLDHGVSAGEIVALTFTHKAAAEMRDRLRPMLGSSMNTGILPEITTFHGLAYGLLQRAGAVDEREFVTDVQRKEVIRQLRRAADLRGVSARELGLILSRHKNGADEGEAVEKLAQEYRAALKARGWRDFDELLVECYGWLGRHPQAAQYRHVLVDEFQDTSEIQYRLAWWLAREGSLYVIGDPNQAIYSFRGAGSEVFGRFARDNPGVLQVKLSANYRSAPPVVAVANAVFCEAALSAQTSMRGSVRVVECLSEFAEADWLVGEIEREVGGTDLIGAGARVGGGSRSFRDFAVIYRTHHTGRVLRRRLEQSGIPFQLAGGGSWYEQPEVARLVAALRVLAGQPESDDWTEGEADWLRRQMVNQVGELPVSELAQRLAQLTGLGLNEETLGDLRRFYGSVWRFETNLGACLAYLTELAASDFYDPAAEAVSLLTIHAAKGLEFSHVFVCGCEEGLMPHARAADKPAGLDEERRLFYVAVTRAKERLDVSFARERGGKPAESSRFLRGLPLDRITDEGMATQLRRRSKNRAKRAQGRLF